MVDPTFKYPGVIGEYNDIFLQQHLAAEIPAARSRAALSYVECMWQELNNGPFLEMDPKTRASSQLFVASISLFGREEIFKHYATSGELHFRNYSSSLQDLTEARNDTRDSISEFLVQSSDSSTTDRYEGLNGAMQDAASIIYGNQLNREQRVKIGQQLNGLLAERKALRGLHSAGFIKSRFSTPSEDAFQGIDIFAAVAGYELPLQIRSTSSRDGRLSIEQSEVPIVRIPTHITRSPFSMKKPERTRLTQFVASNLRPAA